jgi:radical SAM superfamily enzyme YgiQ (UPF0313 family)
MKILFIYPDISTRNNRFMPYGIAALSAVLKKGGHETELLYIRDDVSNDEVWAHIASSNPGLVAFSVVTLQWRFVKKFSKIIKTKFDVPVICGGVHPTFRPEEVISEPGINMICIGEGEYPLLEVADAIENRGDLSVIPNIWVKNEAGTLFKNPIRDLIHDIDALPFPDRDIAPYAEILRENKAEPVFMTSKGCPYNCRFCSNSAIKQLYQDKGRYVRQRRPETVIREIRELRNKYYFDKLNFYDEAFGYNRSWLKRFCELYEQEFRFPFGAMIRAETMDKDAFRIMRKAGLTLIYIGLESGNEAIRHQVLGRKMSNETIIQTCKAAQDEGIQVWTFNMVGVPGETVDTIHETMALNRIINPNFVCVSVYQPFPGTPLYEDCVRNNYIQGDYATTFYEGSSVLDLPTITREDLYRCYDEFQKLSYEIRMTHEEKGDRIFLADI